MQLPPEFRVCFFFQQLLSISTSRSENNDRQTHFNDKRKKKSFDNEHNFAYFFFSITSNFEITLFTFAMQTSSSLFVQKMIL